MKTQIVNGAQLNNPIIHLSDIKDEHNYFYGAEFVSFEEDGKKDGKIDKYFLTQSEEGFYLFRNLTATGKSCIANSLSGFFASKRQTFNSTLENNHVKVYRFDTLKELFQWGVK